MLGVYIAKLPETPVNFQLVEVKSPKQARNYAKSKYESMRIW